MNKKLTWRELKALHDLYEKRLSRAKVKDHPYIRFLLHEKGVLDHKPGNANVLIPVEGFTQHYEQEFKEKFIHYRQFLLDNGIEANARKTFTEEDIGCLMLIEENREELRTKLTNIEDFSAKLFEHGGSKLLKRRISLRKAVCSILKIDEFPDEAREQLWRLVVDYPNPRAIVLCENRSFLKQRWLSQKLQIKLWHVGGNNIGILSDIDNMEMAKPFYYSCDWDNAGLHIYSRIKTRLAEKGKDIHLLFPNEPHKPQSVDSPYHKSKWSAHKVLSGLHAKHFNEQEIQLIARLIQEDKWIEEESTDLSLMLKPIY
jgi:hypothetical protein